MPGKARPGKQKSSSAAKKRLKKTGGGKWANQKPAHNHLLQQKSKRQKRLGRHSSIITTGVFAKQIKRMLPGK
jgi:ribosomal protein L35